MTYAQVLDKVLKFFRVESNLEVATSLLLRSLLVLTWYYEIIHYLLL